MEKLTEAETINIGQNLQGKTALITGASSGLGVRFAQVLAAAGARIIITARRADRLAALAEEITEAGGEVLSETLDVTRLDGFADFYESLNARGWTPDLLVNNAGRKISKPRLKPRLKNSAGFSPPIWMRRFFWRPNLPARLSKKGRLGVLLILLLSAG